MSTYSNYRQHGTSFTFTPTMDDDLLPAQHLYIQHQLEDQHRRSLNHLRFLALALVIAGSNEDHVRAVENRRPRRHYLQRTDLLPNPRVGTPWTYLYESGDDRAFLTTMGVDVSTFRMLMEFGFVDLWYTLPIGRSDIRPAEAAPKPRRRSLDAEGGLGLVLHWLSSTMRHVSHQQIFALTPSTVSRYLRFARTILLMVLRRLPDARITWPRGEEFLELSSYVSARHPLLEGVFGSIDGLNLPCQVSSNIEVENATYNGWKHGHFISSVIVFNSKGMKQFATSWNLWSSTQLQEKSLLAVRIAQAAGTTLRSHKGSTTSWIPRHLLGSALSLTRHFPGATIASLGRSVCP